jgi:hypothetical protein
MNQLHEDIVHQCIKAVGSAWVRVCIAHGMHDGEELGIAAIELAEAEQAFRLLGIPYTPPVHPHCPDLHREVLAFGQMSRRYFGDGDPLTPGDIAE